MLIHMIFNLCIYWTILISVIARDYYDILGINRGASDGDIKRSFRKLAMKYHPDRNKDPNAEEQFREIAAAYEILSNPEKRRQYDQFGESAFNQNGGAGGHHGSGFGGFDFNFNDFFKNFDASFNAHRQGHRAGGAFGGGFGDTFSNFDDLFSDMDSGDSDMFGAGGTFDGFFGGHDSFFGGDSHSRAHNKAHARAHANNMYQAHTSVHSSSSSSGGQRCKTVTKRTGNSVSTYTTCS